MFWLALAAAAAIAPVVRWWFLSRSRAQSTAALTRVIAVGGTGPTAVVARAVAVALSTGSNNVGVATNEGGLRWYEPANGSTAADARRPSTLAELVALAAQLAGPTVSEMVVDAGQLDFASSASARGGPPSDLVVLLGLGVHAGDRSLLIEALCPSRGVVITTESNTDHLAELSAAAARRGSLVVIADTAALPSHTLDSPPDGGGLVDGRESVVAEAVAAAAFEVLNRQGPAPTGRAIPPASANSSARRVPARRASASWVRREARRA